MVGEVNPFESLQEQIDTAAAYMDVDLLIPAALENVIDEELASDVNL